jgi:hypothetical protein
MTKAAKIEKPRDWKKWLDENPLKVIVAACVATSTSTATIVNYFRGEEAKIEQAFASAKLEQVSNKLSAENDKLNERLAGIERRIGGDNVLDVSSLTVGPSQIKSLGPEFSYEESIRCFVSIPTAGVPWETFKTSELGFSEMLIPSIAEQESGLRGSLGSVDVVGWKASETFRIETDDHDVLNIFPFVFVETLSYPQMANAAGKFAKYFEGLESGTEQSIKKVEKSAKSVERALNAKAATSPSDQTSKEKSIAGKDSQKTEAEKPDADVTNFLSEVFNSDAAGFFLFGALNAGFSFTQLVEGSSFRVIDTEKKGNVLYLHVQLVFPPTSKTKQVFWDREWIVVCTAKNFYLIQTSAPSTDERPLEASWITQFLVGLRVPLE